MTGVSRKHVKPTKKLKAAKDVKAKSPPKAIQVKERVDGDENNSCLNDNNSLSEGMYI